MCQIEFRDGLTLRVMSVDRWGMSKPDRNATYAAFVRDFHQRLQAAAHPNIAFVAGTSATLHRYAKIAVLLAGLLLLGGPILLIVAAGQTESWWHLFLGAVVFFPLWHRLRHNKPRTYSPGQIPLELLP